MSYATSPPTSPDPAVRYLDCRRQQLRCEMASLESALQAYAAVPSREAIKLPPVEPLEHAALLNDDSTCGCKVCSEWRIRRDEVEAAMRLIPKGHQWSICACDACRFVGRIHLNYIAASNLRDLVIEFAFHASWHSRHGEKAMQWLGQEISGSGYTVGWCAYEIGKRPVEDWLAKCEKALAPVLSGAVFMVGAGSKVHAQASLVSQLGAAIASAGGYADA